MSDQLHFPEPHVAIQPSVLKLHCDELQEIINGLPKYGTIMYDALTHYWYIELPVEWKEVQDNIVSVVKEKFSDSPWYMESEQLCMHWDDMVNAVHPQNADTAVIDCVPPPSVVGMFHSDFRVIFKNRFRCSVFMTGSMTVVHFIDIVECTRPICAQCCRSSISCIDQVHTLRWQQRTFLILIYLIAFKLVIASTLNSMV